MWRAAFNLLLAIHPLVGGPLFAPLGIRKFSWRADPWLRVFLGGSGLFALGQIDAGVDVAGSTLGQGLLGWLVLRAGQLIGPHPTYAIGITGVGVWAFCRWFAELETHPWYREQLWSYNPNGLGAWMALGGALSVLLVRPGWLGALGFVGAGLGLWASGSRAALLGLLLAGGLAFALRLPRFWRVVLGLGIVVALVASLSGRFDPGRFGTVLDLSYRTSQQRLEIWRIALEAFREHPISGVASLAEYSSNHLSERARELSITEISHAHNLFLQALAEGGILGGLGAFFWVAGATWLLLHLRAWKGLALLGVVVILNLADYTFFNAGVYYPLWIGLAWSISRSSPSVNSNFDRPDPLR